MENSRIIQAGAGLILALLLCIMIPTQARSQYAPDWMDWEAAYQQADSAEKIVLVDVYTDWCKWCKRMEAETYSHPGIVEYLKAHYTAVKLNPEDQEISYRYKGEELSGRDLFNRLAVDQANNYPTTIFVLPTEEAVDDIYVIPGYFNPSEFASILRDIHNRTRGASQETED